MTSPAKRYCGIILGTAVGDSLGLPFEGLSRNRVKKPLQRNPLHQRFFFNKGMVSDDTEHTVMVVQSLLEHPEDVSAFQRAFAWRLRLWFLLLPAGVGLATMRSCVKLWLGFSPRRSGVFSAGNGPAMRSAIIGAFFAKDASRRREFVTAATELSHTDPKALYAALAVAETIASIINNNLPSCTPFQHLLAISSASDWQNCVHEMNNAAREKLSVQEFAEQLGCTRGVSGYALHSVPVALYAWWRHRGDFQTTLVATIECGGDTDTVAAIAGALAGCDTGEPGIPAAWIDELWEWPRSVKWMRQLADTLATPSQSSPRYCWLGLFPRNLAFLLIVLGHALLRLFRFPR